MDESSIINSASKPEQTGTFHQLVQYTCTYEEGRSINCVPFIRTFLQQVNSKKMIEITTMVGSEVKYLDKPNMQDMNSIPAGKSWREIVS